MQKKTFLRTMVSVSLAAFLIMAFAIPGAQAQAKFPSRPMTMICPYGAGGGTDAVARMVAALMEQDLGQPVNVVNRTGGGGAVGHTAGATAAPDGYTMTLCAGDITMLHWMGTAQVNYKDLRAIGQVNFDASAINVRADCTMENREGASGLCQGESRQTEGLGHGKRAECWDIARAGWLIAAGVSPDAIPWVPSSGAAPALQDMMAGGLQVVTCSLPEARALIDAKKVRSLADHGGQTAGALPRCPHPQGIGRELELWCVEGSPGPQGHPG